MIKLKLPRVDSLHELTIASLDGEATQTPKFYSFSRIKAENQQLPWRRIRSVCI